MVSVFSWVKGLVMCVMIFLVIGITGSSGALEKTDAAAERLTVGNALTGIEYIHAWLKSFRALTEMTSDQLSNTEKQQIGNLGRDTQTLGFYNWVKAVEGTLYKQDSDIRRLEYELAKEREAQGKVSQREVTEKETKYQESQEKLNGFLAMFHIAD